MKRLVVSNIGIGAALGVPIFVVVALTGASMAGTYLIAIGFLAIAIAWLRFDGSL